MRPLIIISPSINEGMDELKLSRACCRAVDLAGGLPLAADYGNAAELAEIADGILLSGGGDIQPSLTGDEADEEHLGFICPDRDRFEFELVREAIKRDIPILGICRGMQVMAAAEKGHIIQHFDGHHQKQAKNETSHYVDIMRGSLLYSIVERDRLPVNSFHHQAVGAGHGLVVSAVSLDGYTEAVEGQEGMNSFFLGVQWHPEHLLESVEQMKIFKAFVEAAGRHRNVVENSILYHRGGDMLRGGEGEQKNNR